MYEKPSRIGYSLSGIDGHTADITRKIRGPSGKQGRLVDILASVTTTTAGATTTPHIQVGVTGTLTQSADFDLGAVTAPGAVIASATSGALKKATNTGLLPLLAADTDVVVTLKAATGTGAAGAYDAEIVIDWF